MKTRSERWAAGAGKFNQEQLLSRQSEYFSNPDKCLFCNEILPYVSPAERIKRVYCGKSCSAKYNNKVRIYQRGVTKDVECSECHIIIAIGRNAAAARAKCSECKSKKRKLNQICTICNVSFESLYRRRCCSHACVSVARRNGSSLGGRISCSKNIRRSKDEIALYDLCKNYFEMVRHNEVIIDGWDADIIIDDHQLAVMWNGPWHYRQMDLSNHSLSQVQNRDRIKINTLTNAGWNVVVFEDRDHTPQSAFEHLKLVAEAGFEPFKRVFVASTL